MKFGSKEWFEKVEKNFKFPCTIAFYISNRNKSLQAQVMDFYRKERAELSDVDPESINMYNGEKVALLGVRRLKDAGEYYLESKYFKEHWSD